MFVCEGLTGLMACVAGVCVWERKVYGMIVYIWNMRSGFQPADGESRCGLCWILWMSFFLVLLTLFLTFLLVFQVIAFFLLSPPHLFSPLSRWFAEEELCVFNALCNNSSKLLQLSSLVTSVQHPTITRNLLNTKYQPVASMRSTTPQYFGTDSSVTWLKIAK